MTIELSTLGIALAAAAVGFIAGFLVCFWTSL